MKVYKVKTRFTFQGVFEVKAESRAQAEEYVEHHCGLCLGRDIHHTLPEEDIDWEFPVHPNKKILR